MNAKPLVIILLLMAGIFGSGSFNTVKAQQVISVDTAIALALKNNLRLKSSTLSVSRARAMENSAFDPGKTSFNFSQDPSSGGGNDNSVGISQNFAWPGLYKHQKKLFVAQTSLDEKMGSYTQADVIRETRSAYYEYLFGLQTLKVLALQDSIYRNFIKKSELRYKVGETSNLELITARNKYQEVQAMKQSAEAELAIQQLNLQQLLDVKDLILPAEQMLTSLPLNDAGIPDRNSLSSVYQQQIEVAKAKIGVEKAKAMPDFTIGYAQQLVIKSFDPANLNRGYTPGTRIAGIQFGIGIPIFNGAGRARVNGEKLAVQIAEIEYLRMQNQLNVKYQQELQNYLKYKSMVDYFMSGGLKQADEQLRIAQVSYDLGEIGYIEFIQNMALAVQSKLNYLETVRQLNQSVIQLQFLKGN